jgi:hypothetical protein
MLAARLHRIQTVMAGMMHCTEALRLQALAADAAQLLAAQVSQHVRLECELAQLQVLVTDESQAPAELTCTVLQLRADFHSPDDALSLEVYTHGTVPRAGGA